MSWQTYIDDHLMCPIEDTANHLTASAIIGFDGSVWAQSSTFPQVSFFLTLFLVNCFVNGIYSFNTGYCLLMINWRAAVGSSSIRLILGQINFMSDNVIFETSSSQGDF